MKEGELKVYYKVGGGLNEKLDIAIEKFLKEFGYVRWASGFNMKKGVRDLAFERKEER